MGELIPAEIISDMVIQSAYKSKVIAATLPPWAIFDKTGPGALVSVPQSSALTFAAMPPGGSEGVDNDADTAYNPTDRTLTPVLYGCSLRISWQARNRAQSDPVPYIVNEINTAWAAYEDGATTGFAAQYGEAPTSNPDHLIGTNGVAIDAAIGRQGYQLLLSAGARPPYHWYIDPIQWGELMQDSVARELLKMGGGTVPGPFNDSMPTNTQYYIGQLYTGLHVWVVPSGMVESSGLHSIMAGAGALGMAYEQISTPLSPTPSRLNIDIDWRANHRAWDVEVTVSQVQQGIAFTSTTNKFMAAIIS